MVAMVLKQAGNERANRDPFYGFAEAADYSLTGSDPTN